jgi:hypothetical protein
VIALPCNDGHPAELAVCSIYKVNATFGKQFVRLSVFVCPILEDLNQFIDPEQQKADQRATQY